MKNTYYLLLTVSVLLLKNDCHVGGVSGVSHTNNVS